MGLFKKVLKYLQWKFHDGAERRWLRQCPFRFGMELQVATVFPDAAFVADQNPDWMMEKVYAHWHSLDEYGLTPNIARFNHCF